ncbi:U-scoloptoxin(01)-Cw1a [Procambarus clarkii]|uniref:U-scoloptoxin(01)-Cw1a n=1 Tax=Procambarus clarkii TaxID=6728 RepID=UPI001E6732DF|nr:U-scoloptoxin(01)-Cw1a-like [Procambarus clarkii]XP_045595698.1 U-scoloptoxin(01)-Cw1a-like [Procambarus clarkii]
MKLFLAVLGALVAASSARMAGKLPGGFRIEPGFSCEGREYGFYADIDNQCSAYHICQPVYDDADQLVEMAHFTFLCGQDTVFNQEQLDCAHPKEAFPCADAASIYESSNYKLRTDPVDPTTTPLP